MYQRFSALVVLFVAVLLLALPACGVKEKPATPSIAPGPTFTGPRYLRGTVGSLARLRNADPMLVEHFGLVVGLDGTGSSDVPAFLRERLINQMRRLGMGSARFEAGHLSPQRVLNDKNTAVVLVQGFIPPGAPAGSTFDVFVAALPGTQTTSLAGGRLWTTELSYGGANPEMAYSRPDATAHGPIYLDPLDETVQAFDRTSHQREAIIVAGGKVKESRTIDLILNNPSWQRSRLISDRINERFPQSQGDPSPTAMAKTDLIIRLNVPKRYAPEPREFLTLVLHLYTQRAPSFEPLQAERLADQIREDPGAARRVAYAWRSLGRTVIPTLRRYFEDENVDLRLAALEAAAWLQDERASEAFLELAGDTDPEVRVRVANSLVYLPRSIRGARALRQLLNDDDDRVRISAYESLVLNGNPAVDRIAIRDIEGRVKFYIDRVHAERPLIYVTQSGTPRLVIFNAELGFKGETFAQVWNRRLMLKTVEEHVEVGIGEDIRRIPRTKLQVFFQAPGETSGETFDMVPTVATLAFTMGHRPTLSQPIEGMDLSYGEVVDAVYQLCQDGAIESPIILNQSPLSKRIADYRAADPLQARPETSTRPETGVPQPAGDAG